MSLKTIVREIKRTLIGWERVDRIPKWAFKILWRNPPIGNHYCIVNGKHYIYKLACEDNGGEQGHNWDYVFYRKIKIR